MNHAKYFYPSKNYNDDINIHHNETQKFDYKSLTTTNKSILGASHNISRQNNFTNLNLKNNNEDFKYLNNNISSSLKDQILSPGDDDISQNYEKNKNVVATPYFDDDIVFNKLNYYFLTKNKNSFLNNQIIKSNDDYLNINSNLNKSIKNNKKTLILDLDETLVHSSFKPINFNNISHKPDIFLKINFRDNIHNVYVLKRPYVYEFLKEMNKIYNIIIFTASVKEYANPLLDTLDTEKIIKQRLFREDCCIGSSGKFVKDLKILNMNLKDLILVDNNPISYSYNICNGIPIKTWHFDKTDQELLKLVPVLQFLANVNDVREYIPKLVENDEIDFNKINYMIKELQIENEQNKFLRPRAKSQKKFVIRDKGKNHSCIYSYKSMNNNNDSSNNNNMNINEIKKYEDSKMNIEELNNKKYINNYIDVKTDVYNINHYNNKSQYNNNYERNNNDYNNRNKYYNDKKYSTSYGYNSYIKHNENKNNLVNANNNNNNNMNIKEHTNYLLNKSKNEENKEQVNFTKNKNESIQRYNSKSNYNNNNYLINEYRNLNQNQNQNQQRNKSKDVSNIIKENNNNNDLNMNNNYKDKIKNSYNNTYKNIEINNNNYLKDKYINNNININYLNNIQNNHENNKKNNYIFNYESKVNYGFITPQLNNNKFISNYSINNYSTKNNNINSNIFGNNNLNHSKNINYNTNNKNNNIEIINSNNINKNNNSNFDKMYKDSNKGDYNNDYEYLQQTIKKKDIDNNFNLLNINDYDIHSNTAINFYSSKNNNNNIIYNYGNLNSNLNLNKNLNIIQNNEETKMNNIAIGQINNNLKIDNNLKKHNSPYKISKETNYYIKRRMKLNKEKLFHKKMENENKYGLYVYFNNQKKEKNGNNDNSNNNNYYQPGKYYRNEINYYANKKY